jgi:septal ring factor EnvC (AmiA/AmiB activator)
VNTAEWAALIVAATGAMAALFAGLRNLRGDRFNRDVSSSAALLTGYKDMVDNLGKQLDAVERSLEAEREHRERDRQQWAQERRELHAELDEERRQRAQERRELYAEMDELRECIDKLMRRSPEARTRRDDQPREGA